MSLSKKMLGELNKQINAEMYSAYLYLSMNAWLNSQNFRGMANWMKVQAHEEMEHAMKFYDYIIERGEKVTLTKIEGPKKSWQNVLVVFEEAFAHEKKVTGMIHKLVQLALKEKDDATNHMLQWFVDEQVEEESNASENVSKIKMVGKNNNAGLLVLDGQLAQRKEH